MYFLHRIDARAAELEAKLSLNRNVTFLMRMENVLILLLGDHNFWNFNFDFRRSVSSQKSARCCVAAALRLKLLRDTMREQSSPGDFIDKTWPKDSLYPFGLSPIIQGTVNQNQSFLFQRKERFVGTNPAAARIHCEFAKDSRVASEQITKRLFLSWLIEIMRRVPLIDLRRLLSLCRFRLLFLPKTGL